MPMTRSQEMEALTSERSALIQQKMEHQQALLELNKVFRTGGRMPNDQYKKLVAKQSTHQRAVNMLDGRISMLKSKISANHIVDTQERQSSLREIELKRATTEVEPFEATAQPEEEAPIKTVTLALVDLRRHYQEFAADKTRVGSMRQMAAEFVLKLNPIIKSGLK